MHKVMVIDLDQSYVMELYNIGSVHLVQRRVATYTSPFEFSTSDFNDVVVDFFWLGDQADIIPADGKEDDVWVFFCVFLLFLCVCFFFVFFCSCQSLFLKLQCMQNKFK